MRPAVLIFLILGLIGLLFSAQASAKAIVKESVYVEDPGKLFLSTISADKSLVVDHISARGFEVYGPDGTWQKLSDLGVSASRMTELADGFCGESGYPTSAEIIRQTRQLANRYSDIMTAFSVGRSVNGQELLFVKISDNPNEDEVEPEFKYIANMHGNEIVGRGLMVRLIEKIGEGYQNGDADIRSLVDNTEIYIMPTMNPDGADRCQRGNRNWADLNRDFPDFTTSDNENTSTGREPETRAVMEFQADRQFALSANFHGGAEVVNYPWETSPRLHPLNDMIVDLSLSYSRNAPYMYQSSRFRRGITNGYQWYHVDGGMQDWSTHFHNDLQVTVELSDDKWPPYRWVDIYFERNLRSMIEYMKKVHQGAGVKFTEPNRSGWVRIQNLQTGDNVGRFPFYGSEFYKVLPEGRFLFLVDSGEEAKEVEVFVSDGLREENGSYSQL